MWPSAQKTLAAAATPVGKALPPTAGAAPRSVVSVDWLTRRRCARQDSLAEWSKALASGASPQGRGFEPHSCQRLAGRHSRH